MYLPFVVLFFFLGQKGHGLTPPAISSTRNRGKTQEQAQSSNTTFKGQVFPRSQNPGLMSLDVVAHQSTHPNL